MHLDEQTWLEKENVESLRSGECDQSARMNRRIHRLAVMAPHAVSTTISQLMRYTFDVPVSTRIINKIY
ncbi:hypothetical protein TNCV_4163541 [Trichonephila clavipes]|nr:hypothetical protein TNCV_4163541 [Trichonephila clavipes]